MVKEFDMIDVEVSYAEPNKQMIKSVRVKAGSTVGEAIEQSTIREDFPKIPATHDLEVGIFSKKCTLDEVLGPGDRVEIYRPLLIDPKEARRLKAEVAERRKRQAEQ